MPNVEVEKTSKGFVVKKLPDPPSKEETLGELLLQKDLKIKELKEMNQVLGQQIVSLDLRLKEGGL